MMQPYCGKRSHGEDNVAECSKLDDQYVLLSRFSPDHALQVSALGRIDNRDRKVGDPVAGNVQPASYPDPVEAVNMIQKTL